MADFVMPFGKHKGKLLADLEDGYLEWLGGLEDLRTETRDAVDAEVLRRRGHEVEGPKDSPRLLSAEAQTLGETLIAAGHKALIDRPGFDRLKVNTVSDWLLQSLKDRR